MKFGIHSLLFNETFIEKDLPLLARCKQMGFDAVEIIPFDPDNFPAKKVKQAAADLGLTIYMDTACRSSTTRSRPIPRCARTEWLFPDG